MNITVNGKEETFAQESMTIEVLLKKANVEMPDQVSVQLNGNFVDRKTYASTQVKEGNEVDFLYFLGGGYL